MTGDFHAGDAVAEFMRKGNDEVFMRRCTILPATSQLF